MPEHESSPFMTGSFRSSKDGLEHDWDLWRYIPDHETNYDIYILFVDKV